MGKTYVIISVC